MTLELRYTRRSLHFVALLAGTFLTVSASVGVARGESTQSHPVDTNDVVRDAKTALEWTRADNGRDIDWVAAEKFCSDRPGRWRLPTIKELETIYDERNSVGVPCGRSRCRMDARFEPTADWFWSADFVGSDGSDGAELAWGLQMTTGSKTKSVKYVGEGSRALCVRAASAAKTTALPNESDVAPLPIDQSHTAIVFSWTHRALSHPVARMERVTGTVRWHRTDLRKSSVEVSLPLEGLRTGDETLDKRLRSKDFFDAENFPTISFKSTQVLPKAGTSEFTLDGELTVHGVTKPVSLIARINAVKDEAGSTPQIGFDAEGSLRRSDFGLSRYVPLVSDEVSIRITLEAH